MEDASLYKYALPNGIQLILVRISSPLYKMPIYKGVLSSGV
jgi:hypothetical protein